VKPAVRVAFTLAVVSSNTLNEVPNRITRKEWSQEQMHSPRTARQDLGTSAAGIVSAKGT